MIRMYGVELEEVQVVVLEGYQVQEMFEVQVVVLDERPDPELEEVQVAMDVRMVQVGVRRDPKEIGSKCKEK